MALKIQYYRFRNFVLGESQVKAVRVNFTVKLKTSTSSNQILKQCQIKLFCSITFTMIGHTLILV